MENKGLNTGTVFEIERFAINDGPGIRSIVFLKGCPLKCKWCANPESQKTDRQLMYWISRCMGCRRCISACPNSALTWTGEHIMVDRNKCVVCGLCANICNSEALTTIGRLMTVDDVMNVVSRDEDFYMKSGGGVTFSGGEAFMQTEFLKELAAACKHRGYHTCVETSAYTKWENILSVLDCIDLFLFDFKCMDEKTHNVYIGDSNSRILENYKKLMEHGKNVIARIPVIPGINDNTENFQMLGDFLQMYNPGCRIDLLPYHRLGTTKYDRLDMRYDLKETEPPSQEEMENHRNYLLDRGFEVTIGG